jgi:hypothetical protein
VQDMQPCAIHQYNFRLSSGFTAAFQRQNDPRRPKVRRRGYCSVSL